MCSKFKPLIIYIYFFFVGEGLKQDEEQFDSMITIIDKVYKWNNAH